MNFLKNKLMQWLQIDYLYDLLAMISKRELELEKRIRELEGKVKYLEGIDNNGA